MDIKVGSRSADLTSAFVEFVLSKLRPGPLATLLRTQLHCATFPRTDERNAEMAAGCQVRIVFGGDEAAEAIDRLPHPPGSVGYYFVDKRSEAWLESSALTDEALSTLIKVFTIYGRAGCTSPGGWSYSARTPMPSPPSANGYSNSGPRPGPVNYLCTSPPRTSWPASGQRPWAGTRLRLPTIPPRCASAMRDCRNWTAYVPAAHGR